jgi:hypothetical protein
MKKLLLGYRGNMRVEVETDVAVTAKQRGGSSRTADLAGPLALNLHVDLDPRFSA